MPETYYPETEDEIEENDAEDTETETEMEIEESPENKGEETESTLVPISAFGGNVKAGDTFTGKIVHVYEDEVEVAFRSAKPSSNPSESPQKSADVELDELAKE